MGETRVVPLGDGLPGVRLTGVDLATAGGGLVGRLVGLLDTAGLVVVPGQHLGEDALRDLALGLGEPETVLPAEHRLPGTEYVRLQSTVPGEGVNGGGAYWHADGSWKHRPTAVTMLACRVAPASGGTTSFVDGRSVYHHLDDRDRADADTASGFHPCREIMLADYLANNVRDRRLLDSISDVVHPLVRTHPRTSDRAVILHGMVLAEVRGLPPDRGRDLLERLYRTIERDVPAYRHTWRVGDLLLWDNRLVMHRAWPVPDSASKVTLRITLDRLWSDPDPDPIPTADQEVDVR